MRNISSAFVCALCLLGLAAQAEADQTVLRSSILSVAIEGSGTVGEVVPTEAPGYAFSLDFAALQAPGNTDPVIAHRAMLFVDCYWPFSSLHIQLNSAASDLVFTPNASTSLGVTLCNPTYYPNGPNGDVPWMVMPDEWITEMSDGVLSGSFWVEGLNPGTAEPHRQYLTFHVLAANAYVVPEPATLSVLGFTAVALLRRRGRP